MVRNTSVAASATAYLHACPYLQSTTRKTTPIFGPIWRRNMGRALDIGTFCFIIHGVRRCIPIALGTGQDSGATVRWGPSVRVLLRLRIPLVLQSLLLKSLRRRRCGYNARRNYRLCCGVLLLMVAMVVLFRRHAREGRGPQRLVLSCWNIHKSVRVLLVRLMLLRSPRGFANACPRGLVWCVQGV
jgi:hypothetical protein